MKQRSWVTFSALAFLGIGAGVRAGEKPDASAPEFNRDIRPILANNCLTCHGPDGHQRKAKLRLDNSDDARAEHKRGTPVVPGNLAKSEVIQRITSTDPDEVMPPPKSEKKLTPRQIELLKKWVAQGAKYEKHWAFIPPRRPALPVVKDPGWCKNPVDRFILARLEQEGLKPSPEADKVTLCRRLYLDLLGLPPTPKEVDQFVADTSPDAYEKLVDKLLANPHYGERMALDWLDAARYADTNGYHIDSGRDQTRWREWVIDAFNQNKPFDHFTIEQMAGDLLPNATMEQKIATGFVRNNMINFEGGAVPEEYLTAYLVDRVTTTSMVFLGLTLNCAQCHDHKFDPLTQRNFYEMYAFFNAVPENGLDGGKGNAVPLLLTPSKQQQEQLKAIAASIKTIEQKLAGPMPELDAEQTAWETTALDRHPQWTVLQPTEMRSKYGATMKMQGEKAIAVSGVNAQNDIYTLLAPAEVTDITAIRLEALPGDRSRTKVGRSPNGNAVLTDFLLTANGSLDKNTGTPMKFKIASADFSQAGFPISNAIDEDPKSGWGIYPEVNKPHTAVFELAQPIHDEGGTTLKITMKFSSEFSEHQFGRFRLSVTGSKSPHGADVLSAGVRRALALAPEKRTDAQRAEVQLFFRTNVCSATRTLGEQITKLKGDSDAVEKAVPTTMVMAEMAKPRDTFILMRGQYDKHGEKVTANVIESLAPLPAGAPHNRLGLAEWLVSPEQPLTSRVTVNRFWQSFFGTGIAKTVEDLGTQGDEPTHPELLDWLAVQFIEGGEWGSGFGVRGSGTMGKWDVKAMVKLIVSSATYRQSSAATPELVARDPENRLLARGARFRLPAEFIRDQALSISGLLDDEIGGKSVSPYQPTGLWEELMSRGDGAKWTAQVYVQDHGKDLYRRTMYTFWKRTSPPPTLSTFDAPGREFCTVRRSRTNTPLQALVLMNDPTYVEASRKLAERMMTEVGASDEAKITAVFRLATSRAPTAPEIAVLRRIHDRELAHFQQDPESAKKLLGMGESPRNEKLDQAELAAWTTVASVVLNLDETITKG